MTPEEHLCAANPEADPDEIARFVSDLARRDMLIVPPDDTVPQGCRLLSEEDVVRQTDPVVWSRPPRVPVALSWAGAQVYEKRS